MAIAPIYQTLLDNYDKSLTGTSKRRERIRRGSVFFEWLESRPLDADNIRAYQNKLKKRYATGSIKLDIEILHRLCKVNGIDWPLNRGETPIVNERDVYAPRLDPQDIHSMIEVVRGLKPALSRIPKPEHAAFLCLSTIWGLRREEMASIQPDMLDRKASLIFVETAKKGRQRWHTVPDFIWPYLESWDFRRISLSRVSNIFKEIGQMIGFTGKMAYQVNWHAIRRSLVKELEISGVVPSDISSFLRWKRSTSNMQSRYATTLMVGTKTTELDLGKEDKDTDQRVLDKHPFLPWWR